MKDKLFSPVRKQIQTLNQEFCRYIRAERRTAAFLRLPPLRKVRPKAKTDQSPCTICSSPHQKAICVPSLTRLSAFCRSIPHRHQDKADCVSPVFPASSRHREYSVSRVLFSLLKALKAAHFRVFFRKAISAPLSYAGNA